MSCAIAAKNGHFVVLQWMLAYRCPRNKKTCAKAAKNGHLAVLQQARATSADGTQTCAHPLPKTGTSTSSSGHGPTGAPKKKKTLYTHVGNSKNRHLKVLQ